MTFFPDQYQAAMGPGGVPYVLPTTLAQVQQDPQILHMQQAPMRMQAPMQGAMQHMQQQYHAAAAQQAYVPLGGLQQAAPQFYYAPATFAYAGAPGLAAFDPAAGPSAAAPQPLAAPAPAPAAPAPGPRGPRGGRGRRGGAAARQQAVWQQAAAAGGLDAMGNVVGGGGGLGGMGMAALTGQGGYVVMTVEDILAVLQALPRGRSAVQAVGHCLGCLDSRALAALFKELHKSSLQGLAVELFDWLRGLPPGHEYAALLDVYTYTTIIAQCTGPSQLRRALSLVADMRARGVGLNTHTYSALLNVCIKAGQPELALDVYTQMLSEGLTPNLVTYNTLLEVYAKQAKWEQALSTLDALQRQGLSPETRTYNVVMAACNAAGKYAQCLAVFSAMMAAGRAPSTASLNSAITAHCRLGSLDAAWSILQDMATRGCERTPATYMALLHAAEGAGRWRIALDVLDAMAAGGVRLTPQAYAAAVGACAAAGQLKAARDLTAKLQGPPGQARSCLAAPAHMLVVLHDRCCDWGAAYAVYEGLAATGVRADAHILGALTSALWGAGSAAGCLLALRVFEEACRLGVFKLTVRVDEASQHVVFVLPAVGPGMAVIALWRLFQELTSRLTSDGPQILRQSVMLLVGQEERREARVAEAMRTLCAAKGSPFVTLEPDDPAPALPAGPDGAPPAAAVRLTARSDALALWLLANAGRRASSGAAGAAGAGAQPKPVLVPTDALDGISPASLLSQQEEVLASAAAAYARLDDGDDAAGGAGGGAGASGSASASALFGLSERGASLSAATSLSLTPSDSMGSLLAAGGGGAPPGAAAGAAAALAALRSALAAGAAAHAAAAGAPLADSALLGRGAANVAAQAAAHPLARGLPPRRAAELALCACRRAAGLWPAWPRALVPVTGCADPEAADEPRAAPELLAHVAALAAAAAGGAAA